MPRGDGRLTHDLIPGEKGPQDACGVFGVWAPGEEVAKLTYFGLYALQHRGQESAGIAVCDGAAAPRLQGHGPGLPGLRRALARRPARPPRRRPLPLLHHRRLHLGERPADPRRPPPAAPSRWRHNGNLINTAELRDLVDGRRGGDGHRGELARGNTTDTALVTALLADDPDRSIEARRARACCRSCAAPSASSSWTSTRSTPPATRRASARWCSAGWSAAGWWPPRPPRSTSSAPRSSARSSRASSIAIDEDGLRSQRFAEPTPKGCVFEYVYLARPDTTIAGRGVHDARVEIGRRLAREHPVEADLVIPMPESGTPAAIGYAEESRHPLRPGPGQELLRRAAPSSSPRQTIRQLGIRLKLNPLRDVIRGKRLVVVDDSIVRGNTQRALVRMLREAGAAEVHVRISSPPVKWPCFYGIDFATRAELIANGLGVEEIRASHRRRLARLHLAGGHDRGHEPAERRLCRACFDGVPDRAARAELLGKPRAARASTCSTRRAVEADASPTSARRRRQHRRLTGPDAVRAIGSPRRRRAGDGRERDRPSRTRPPGSTSRRASAPSS